LGREPVGIEVGFGCRPAARVLDVVGWGEAEFADDGGGFVVAVGVSWMGMGGGEVDVPGTIAVAGVADV
jgi:hypothetical protein